MNPFPERKVPALFKSKASFEENVSVSLVPGVRSGFMVKDEYIDEVGKMTSKIFPTESTAKSYASGREVIPVEVRWKI